MIGYSACLVRGICWNLDTVSLPKVNHNGYFLILFLNDQQKLDHAGKPNGKRLPTPANADDAGDPARHRSRGNPQLDDPLVSTQSILVQARRDWNP
ncbi:hypothetical protein Hdeb2414_s0018g00530011 [Helianthus debilis subsp. tardiflorus]